MCAKTTKSTPEEEQEEWKEAEKILERFLKYASTKSKKTGIKFRKKDHPNLKHSFIYINETLYRMEVHHYLGHGTYGKVKEVTDKKGNPFALKIEEDNPSNPDYKEEEISILQKLDSFQGKFSRRHSSITEDRILKKKIDHKFYILQKLAPGRELQELLNSSKLENNDKKEIALLTILETMKLHKDGIIHCDLKSSNVIVDLQKPIKTSIIDFGLSKKLPEGEEFFQSSLRYINIPNYIAPEFKDGYYSTKLDVFSLGYMFKYKLGLNYPFINEMLKEDPKERCDLHYALCELVKEIPLTSIDTLSQDTKNEPIAQLPQIKRNPLDNITTQANFPTTLQSKPPRQR